MRAFPNERERSFEVQHCLAPNFELCEAMHNFWLDHDKDRWLKRCKLPPTVTNVAAMLDMQVSRLFRSVVEECRRGEAHNASILCRTLLETLLAQKFVLSKRLLIVVFPVINKRDGKPKLDKSGLPIFAAKEPTKTGKYKREQWLPRELRANLYLAHQWSSDEQDLEEMSTSAGTKRTAKKVKKQLDAIGPREYEKEIGPEWTSILRHYPFTYSGLKVRNLASVLHKSLVRWYDKIYHWQSRPTHASDGLKHLRIADDGQQLRGTYVSSVSDVYQALRPAMALFKMNLWLLQKYVGFGPDVDLAYDSFRRKFFSTLQD